MSLRRSLLFALLCAGLVNLQARAQESSELGLLVNEYLTSYWQFRPVSAATPAGVHSQDKVLEDWSASAVQAEITRNRFALDHLQRIDPKKLTPISRADREALLNHVRLALVDLEAHNSMATRPDRYALMLGNACWSLSARQFAPATARFAAVTERLKQFPKVLKQARLDFQNPPEIFTRKALEILPMVADYIEKDVPNAATQQGVEKRALSNVQKESRVAAAAVRDFAKWMQADLLPRSRGKAVVSENVYRQIFHDLLGTEMTPESVQAAAEAELGKAKLPAGPAETLDASGVLQAFRKGERESRMVVEEKRFVQIPMPDRLQFEPAPPFSPRHSTWLDPAGAFEPDLAYFLYVPAGYTLARDAVNAELIRHGHPGGYVQRDAMSHTDSVIRKVFPNRAFIAGWEEYAAILMREAGVAGAVDPSHDRAVWLDAIFDIRINLGKITTEEAVKELTGQFGCSPEVAADIVYRVLSTPGEASAAFVGKLELLRLREETRRSMGAAFIPREYHTHLLSLGGPTFASARELLPK